MGCSKCRICGKDNGSAEFTDLVYLWTEGLSHYVKDHDVKLPLEFLNHIDNNRRYDEPGIEWDRIDTESWVEMMKELKKGDE